MKYKQKNEPLQFLSNGIAQVALVVKDLDRAVEQYWKLFRIGPWHIYTYGKPLIKKMSYRGKPADYRLRIGLAWIGSLRIELIQPLGGDSVFNEFIREHGYGVHHFGVLVQNMEEAIARAKSEGLEMIMDGSGFGKLGDGHYAYLDTENKIGTTIELISRPKDRMPPDAIYPPEADHEPGRK
jgi:methylmalonyl-CoA/ethylmalonyl-CoA epimerase